MESLVTEAGFVVDDDLLNFSLEGVCEEEPAAAAAAATALCRAAHTGSFPEIVEEELEWLSNKDAFPAVETCFGILSDNPGLILNHQSPVSVLENSNSSISAGSNGSSGNGGSSGGSIASCCNSIKVPTKYPVRARSKRRRKRRTGFTDLPSQQQCVWMNQVNVVVKNKKQESQLSLPPLPLAATTANGGGGGAGGGMGRRCWHCQADKTPQWRAGPMGPKTLCNACGVRYKSGRLLPEYRPANSPTFSSNLHSNSHRKVVEMRRQKQAVVVPGEGIEVNVSCGYFG